MFLDRERYYVHSTLYLVFATAGRDHIIKNISFVFAQFTGDVKRPKTTNELRAAGKWLTWCVIYSNRVDVRGCSLARLRALRRAKNIFTTKNNSITIIITL